MLPVVLLSLLLFIVLRTQSADMDGSNIMLARDLSAKGAATPSTLPTMLEPTRLTAVPTGGIQVDTRPPSGIQLPVEATSAPEQTPNSFPNLSQISTFTVALPSNYGPVPSLLTSNIHLSPTVNPSHIPNKEDNGAVGENNKAKVWGAAVGVSLGVLILGALVVWWVVWWKTERRKGQVAEMASGRDCRVGYSNEREMEWVRGDSEQATQVDFGGEDRVWR